MRVTALDPNGKPATVPIDITIQATSPRGSVSLSGTRIAITRNGVASFPRLAVSGAGRGIVLSASAPGLTAVPSTPFDVWLHFKEVSAGHTSACGLTYENLTWCWGDNTLSRLGVGDDVPRSTPTRLLGDFRFDTITSGGIQQCGRLTSREVLCWGGRHPTPTPVAGRKLRLEVARDRYYYPDVAIVCTPVAESDIVARDPCVVIEVTSPSTAQSTAARRSMRIDRFRRFRSPAARRRHGRGRCF